MKFRIGMLANFLAASPELLIVKTQEKAGYDLNKDVESLKNWIKLILIFSWNHQIIPEIRKPISVFVFNLANSYIFLINVFKNCVGFRFVIEDLSYFPRWRLIFFLCGSWDLSYIVVKKDLSTEIDVSSTVWNKIQWSNFLCRSQNVFIIFMS